MECHIIEPCASTPRPSQIPACGFPAPGSSPLFASCESRIMAAPLFRLPRSLTPSPTALILVTRLNRLGRARPPCGLRNSLCTLQLLHFSLCATTSSGAATLDTGDWLGLARSGLPPDKKRQAALDALTLRSTRGC